MSNRAVQVPAILNQSRVSADSFAEGDWASPVSKITALDNNRLVGTSTAQMATQWQRDRWLMVEKSSMAIQEFFWF